MNSPRIAWLLTAAPSYWHPVLSEFTRIFPQTTLFTGSWSKFAQGYENSFAVEEVGTRKVIRLTPTLNGYGATLTFLSPSIIHKLLRFKPDVIFTDGFCMWTVFVLVLKVFMKWRVVVIYDGSSPSVDYKNSGIRIFLRRLMSRFADAFITNNCGGKDYLVNFLEVKENIVFAQPYLVPDTKALLHNVENDDLTRLNVPRPIFLYVGQIIPRKGIGELLEACSILHQSGYHDYTLLIVGEGWQQEELEHKSISQGLENNVRWIGQVEYSSLGFYFKYADIFVFPTHEDVWGMVVPEAMAVGKPILVSKWAGAAELVEEGKNGYIFDSQVPERLAELMKCFIDNPELATSMGNYSQEIIAKHNPETAAQFLADVTNFTEKK